VPSGARSSSGSRALKTSDDAIVADLKKFMRYIPQPVTILTTVQDGKLSGITVSAFTSISMNPPLVLVGLSKTAPSHGAIVAKGRFVVNLLDSGQDFLGERFAGLHKVDDKFHDVPVSFNKRGMPFLVDCAANIDCDVSETIETGDHSLILAAPVSISIKKKADPLVYYNQQFCHVAYKGTLVLPEDYS
jgi:3-hydroxy-9,10-secoandrosta-1,3,5(10)-triene-9,17-dione monooxygenase reductase component